jgi:hypothetical protein
MNWLISDKMLKIDTTLSVDEFAEKCIEYNKESGEFTGNFEVCPVHVYACIKNKGKSCKAVNPTIKNCLVCGKACVRYVGIMKSSSCPG